MQKFGWWIHLVLILVVSTITGCGKKADKGGTAPVTNKVDPAVQKQVQESFEKQKSASETPDAPPSEKPASVTPASPVTSLAPASNLLDLTFVPSDAFAAKVIHPRRIFEHPVVAGLRKLSPDDSMDFGGGMPLPVGEMMGDMKRLRDMGILPQNIDEVVVVLDKEFPDQVKASMENGKTGVPGIGVIVRNSAPFAVDALVATVKKLDPKSEIHDHEGVSIVAIPEHGLGFAMIDQSMFIAGQEAFVKKMISARESATPTTSLTKRLHAAGNRLLVVAVDAAAIESSVDKMSKDIPLLPAEFSKYITGTKEIGLTFDLDAPEMLQVDLQFKTTELSKDLFGTIEPQFNSAKEQAKMFRGFLELDENSKPFMPYFDQVIADIKLTNSAETISLTIPKVKDLEKLPDLLKPAVEKARLAAERFKRRNNLRQIGIAMHNYHESNNGLPALNGPAPEGSPHPGLSWRVYILPFLDQQSLFRKFNLEEPWDSEQNKALISQMPEVFGKSKDGKTSIQVFTGPGAPFQNGKGLKFAEVLDGMSNTIMLVEAGDDVADTWTKPGGLVFDPENPLKCLGEIKEFGALLMDGSSRELKNVEAETFGKLIQRADGKPVELPE